MPSNEQRRQAAKRKLERRLAHQAARAKRNRRVALIASVASVIVVVGAVYLIATSGDEEQQPAAQGNQSDACEFPAAQEGTQQVAKEVNPPENTQPEREGTVSATMETNQGTIPITLDRSKAPCTVESMAGLVEQQYFNDTSCHRVTTSDGLKVLQCGDPSGSGAGGPGYTVPDEPPEDLEPAPESSEQQEVSVYPRGTLAMANSGSPNSGGSQFFMVYGDSKLPPDYTVFGSIDEEGLRTLDKIAKNGVEPADGQPAEDGAPAKPVDISTVELAA
ncbi:peptidyl-prolyl cis-trans isomerase B (cyclophilin B) [Tamaricihabitans halophyticus]|uniref:Peptidyl-prolyl cis-trans isomerase B (Cyclophilin B) n=1 Tax=Tamaricihabitans halophyticus TaxID=1262583 RepID=A0A4R2QBM1_9PSEU|nr:peptidylprolyl isomerase [Tamaricihabitans halophyticus]TCP46297.1 peptidyl-prolyl cis-trans isomerase B (cyclophilin B) [Tamaricihabitans halophyticus]